MLILYNTTIVAMDVPVVGWWLTLTWGFRVSRWSLFEQTTSRYYYSYHIIVHETIDTYFEKNGCPDFSHLHSWVKEYIKRMSLIYTVPGVSSSGLRNSIYIGGRSDAKSLEKLQKWRISRILNVTPTKEASIQVGDGTVVRGWRWCWLQAFFYQHVMPVGCESSFGSISLPAVSLSFHIFTCTHTKTRSSIPLFSLPFRPELPTFLKRLIRLFINEFPFMILLPVFRN